MISYLDHEFERDTSRLARMVRDIGRLKCRLCGQSVKYGLRKGWPEKRMAELGPIEPCAKPKQAIQDEPSSMNVSLLNED